MVEEIIKESNVERYENLLRPLIKSSKAYYIFVGFLLTIVAWAAYAWYIQLTYGLVVTGLRDTVFWGVYLTNFIFFIGISIAGTLLSAILRVTHAEWRKPLTRMAEVITVFSLWIAMLNIIFDLGRPDRMFNMLFYGRLESPLIWDLVAVQTYLFASLLFLYLPLVPDIAFCRDKLSGDKRISVLKRRLFKVLPLNWAGTEQQKMYLERGIKIMAILLIPTVVSVHSVLAWIFGVTLRVGWHSTIYAPYFIAGALFSGLAALILVVAVFRRVYHLEKYIKPLHFEYMGLLLLVAALIYIYFMISEYLTLGYAAVKSDVELLQTIFGGQYAPLFFLMLQFGFIIPVLIMAIPKTRTLRGVILSASLVLIAMWIKRYLIIVPPIALQSASEFNAYAPTWVEWSLTAGSIAGFILLLALFSKVFPIISIWEVSEESNGD